MYALANRVSPADLELVARQLFIEMLKAGYTSVAEFHYIHRREDGAPYEHENPLHEAIIAAARATGIGLTLLPTLYQHSDFDAAPLRADQRRFAASVTEFLRMVAQLKRRETASQQLRCGAAFHSLRAVGPAALHETSAGLRDIDPQLPVHIHIAEQSLEVKACLQSTGQRPVQWLLAQGLLNPQWCLVHATHANRSELRGVVEAGASVCICTTTEANLGDGQFDINGFLSAGGAFCLGSDSQVGVDPGEELRWLEYQQRLKRRRRAVLAAKGEAHVGTRLWAHAAATGARALRQPVGELRVGARADWLVLDPAHALLAGAPPERVLDRFVFGGGRGAIRDVVVGGTTVVREGRHAFQQDCEREFLTWMREMQAAGR
jgi:formimidoylglutamate deiminase